MKTQYMTLLVCVLLISCTTVPTQPPRAPKNISIIDLLSSPKKSRRSLASESTSTDNDSVDNVYIDTSIDGSWKLGHLECPEGAKPEPDVEAYFNDKNNFSYFHFDKGTITTQSAEKGCLIEGVGTYTVDGGRIIFPPPKSWLRKCPGKDPERVPMRGEQDPFIVRNDNVGEPELVFELSNGKSCNDGSHGKVVLIRNLTE